MIIEIEQLASAAGHCVLFTPPHFSYLLPIELVWARIKGAVARDYLKCITFSIVRKKLDDQFEWLGTDEGSEAISDIIDSVDFSISKFMSDIAIDEEKADEMIPSSDTDSDLSVYSDDSTTESDSD